ncbi:MAG: DUF799 family lipoprotein [Candidatus Cloacimonadaceae bacterium]|nr:DUF799 family lipoprotein [Candidatus Cloacimonadaceae bacterium]MDP3114472.1 DUF799 family lipoprotein [Candidatus Cloacimonadaceae bacterium]
MIKRMILPLIVAAFFLLTGCVTNQYTLRETFPKMYENPPTVIIIMPPINQSTAAEAKEYFASSLSEAMGLTGYNPLSVESVFAVLRDEGLYDTETINDEVLKNLKKYFGADAVLVTQIERWDKSWFLLSGTLSITAKYMLYNTDTGEVMWDFTTITEVSLGSSNENLLVSIIESAVKTATEDYFEHARRSNILTFKNYIPHGKYHPLFGADGEATVPSSKVGNIKIAK